jgi:hypothetical protein
MRRFCLLLLALVLPLQMSWAAMHFCDGITPAAATVQASEHSGESHAHASSASQHGDGIDQTDLTVDPCCDAAHGCHGLHTLMNQDDSNGHAVAAAHFIFSSPLVLARNAFSTRHERPQWPAA